MTENSKPYVIVLNGPEDHKKAIKALGRAPAGYRLTFEPPKRSDDQNRLLWALLRSVSQQKEYWGAKRSPEAWKDIFTAALRDVMTVPSLDGRGIVQIGLRTSKLNKQDFADLIELIKAYAAEHGIQLEDEARAA